MLWSTGGALASLIEWMGPEGTIGSLLGAGTLGMILKTLIDKYAKPKVERDAAEDDAHEKAQRMSLALAESLRAELTRVGERVTSLEQQVITERTAREGLQTKVTQQESTMYGMRTFIARVLDYFADLTEQWDHHRLRDTPPTPPRYQQEV